MSDPTARDGLLAFQLVQATDRRQPGRNDASGSLGGTVAREEGPEGAGAVDFEEGDGQAWWNLRYRRAADRPGRLSRPTPSASGIGTSRRKSSGRIRRRWPNAPYVNDGTHVIWMRSGTVVGRHARVDTGLVVAAFRRIVGQGIAEAAAAPIED